MDTVIIQQAVKHWSGIFLVSVGDTIQYEDTKGHVIIMSGGTQYFQRSADFPGAGCEDYSLTVLSHNINDKLLYKVDSNWKLVKDMSPEQLLRVDLGTLSPTRRNVFEYWKSFIQI